MNNSLAQSRLPNFSPICPDISKDAPPLQSMRVLTAYEKFRINIRRDTDPLGSLGDMCVPKT